MRGHPAGRAARFPRSDGPASAGGSAGLVVLLLATLALSLSGIRWGLPSRTADRHLFGNRTPWTGREIMELTGPRPRDPARGADMDAGPLQDRDRVRQVNADDRSRAEIVRRYRLYSHHPDEMVTFMALAAMSPSQGDFDPRVYQYGGLWIYPVGLLLRLASAVGAIRLTPDPAYYLDHPEAFRRFYIVARAWVAAWALAAAWAVRAIALVLCGGDRPAATRAGLCAVLMPVMITAAHEAKPHLPGAALMLMSIWAAMRYLVSADARWRIACSILAGAAVATVLSAWPAAVLACVLPFLVRQPRRRRLQDAVLSASLVVAVYAAANPYVIVHLLGDRRILLANLGNTREMFAGGLGLASTGNAARLILQATSPPAALLAAAAAAAWPWLRTRGSTRLGTGTGLVATCVLPAALVLFQFVWFAGDQQGEYARFALPVAGLVAVAACRLICALIASPRVRVGILNLLVALTAIGGLICLRGFLVDASDSNSRNRMAETLRSLQNGGARTLAVLAEPAPYAVPPVDLFAWEILLLPRGWTLQGASREAPADVIIQAVDRVQPPPNAAASAYAWRPENPPWLSGGAVSWANKPFVILVRRELLPSLPEPPP